MNVILRLGIIVLILYVAVLALLYFFQERLIFFPSKLEPNHEFSFDQSFEEIRLDADGAWISGLRFLAQSRDGEQIYGGARDMKGERKAKNGAAIFFHGNAGNLQGWGKYARYFTDLGYDFYLFDYRGYGKSGGEISSQEQLYADADAMMESVLREYDAGEVTALGYSVGSGLAARTAQKYGARYIDISDAICDNGKYLKEGADKKPLRKDDGMHISMNGAKKVALYVVDKLLNGQSDN